MKKIISILLLTTLSVGCVSRSKYKRDLESNFDLGMLYGLSLSLKTVKSQKTNEDASFLIKSFIDTLVLKHQGKENG